MNTIKFLEYNNLMKQVMSEQDTLENIFDLVVEKKPSKEEKEALKSTESWAKYAYDNNKEYHITFFKNEKIIAYINNSFFDITIDLFDFNQGVIFKYLSMTYYKYNMDIVFKENRNEKFPNDELFLGQINNYLENENTKTETKLVFRLNGNANIFINTFDKKISKINTEAKKTKVNITNNFIRCPKEYKDYEYLLDYKNILKPEYLNLTNDN
jgi:hypothetical protein